VQTTLTSTQTAAIRLKNLDNQLLSGYFCIALMVMQQFKTAKVLWTKI
jgi:hypothetical protein